MGKKIIFTIIILVVFSTTLKSQWTVYQTNTTLRLNKIQFLNENTGFAAGGSVLFKTTNGGNNWFEFVVYDSTAPSVIEIYGLFFVNANTGFVCGRYLDIYRTSNGGINWVAIRPPFYSLTQIYNALYFIDENTGYAAGRYGYFCKTTNSGLNWVLTSVLPANLFSVWFNDSTTGYVGGGNGTVYKTTDGGYNFAQTFLGTYSIESIKFSSANSGLASGYNANNNSAIYKTSNAGLDWSIIYQGNFEIFEVFLIDNNTGYSCGDGRFLTTTNSGQNWITTNAPFYGLSLYFFNPNAGFVSGSGGKIYKTTNGGVGIINISTEIPNEFKLFQNYPNPFNPTTKIRFDVGNGFPVKTTGNDKGGNFVVLKVYDVMGREVQTLVNERLQPGTYETTFDGFMQNSGIYFYKLTTDGFSETKKMLLLK